MQFNIENYPGKYVMHCKTEEEAKDFFKYLTSVGRKWCTGEPCNSEDTYWFRYMESMAYEFNHGSFASVSYYKSENYTILEWEDFMNKTFTKADLKTGDVIKRRNGYVEIVILEHGVCVSKTGFNLLSGIDKDLTNHTSKEWDVVAVHRPKNAADCRFSAFELGSCNLVYEREEAEEMTLAQVCALLGKNIKIVKE